MRRSVLHVGLAVLLFLPPATSIPTAVLWAPNVDSAYQENRALATDVAIHPPTDSGISGAFDVAIRSLDSRRTLVPGDSDDEVSLRHNLDREKLNLQSAQRVQGILTGSGTDREKAFSVLNEALTSRPQILGTTSARMQGYFDQARAASNASKTLAENYSWDIFDIAGYATTVQAAQLGITVPNVAVTWHTLPSISLQAYANARAIPVTQQMLDSWAPLDALPSGTAGPLAHVIDAFLVYENATADAFNAGNGTMLGQFLRADAVEVNDTLAHASNQTPAYDWNQLARSGVDVGPILGARSQLLGVARDLRDAIAVNPPPVACGAPVTLPPSATSYNILVDINSCQNSYNASVGLLVDFGGNDSYHNNAGGNRLVASGGCDEPVDDQHQLHDFRQPTAAAAFDFGGNDAHDGPICGVNGGASLGAGLLVDIGGNDVYATAGSEQNNVGRVADGEGVNGGGHVGVGMLLDSAGSDQYFANGSYGMNGGSLVGIGTLVDTGTSHDVYWAGFGGANGAADIGSAFLFDAAGDDTYNAEGRAGNGAGLWGAGLLVDLSGNDTYYAFNMSRPERYAAAGNGGAKFGMGFLYDQAGSDSYIGLRDGADGGGVDGIGVLVDVAGRDYYNASYNGTIGSGWSLLPTSHVDDTNDLTAQVIDATLSAGIGAGVLIDLAGDDIYHGGMFATIGGAYIGTGFLVDASGNDTYRSRDGGGAIGGVGGHNKGLGLALLLDGSGNDTYTEEVWEIDPETHDRPRVPDNEPGSIEFGGKGAIGGGCLKGAVALLVDFSGNDAYRGNSSAINGGAASGGVGMIVDGGGNDTYTARDRGTNGGAYGGSQVGGIAGASAGSMTAFGFLIDIAGNDRYSSGSQGHVLPNGTIDAALSTPGYGANGGGFRAIGFLFDGGGADAYWVNGTAVNGGAALGVGLLVDVPGGLAAGNDRYNATKAAIQTGNRFGQNGGIVTPSCTDGTCMVGSVGLLLDVSGTDTYWDDDSPYAGRGTNACVFPKYAGESGYGQQRDVSSALYVSQASLDANCLPI